MVFPGVLSLDPFSLPCTLNLFLTKYKEHDISYQKYADDTQLHKVSQPTEFQC